VLLSVIRKEGGGRWCFIMSYAHEPRDRRFYVWNRVFDCLFLHDYVISGQSQPFPSVDIPQRTGPQITESKVQPN
jgi:hypothetical protein